MFIETDDETLTMYCVDNTAKKFLFTPFRYCSMRILYENIAIPFFLEE